MRSMVKLCLFGLLLIAISASTAHADSFKCGQHFVEIGDSKASVRLHCGEPFFAEVISADDERKIEQWAYQGNGYRGFIRVLTFNGGTLKNIKVGERGN